MTFRGSGVEYESCENWFQAKCQNIANVEYANMQDVDCIYTNCCNQQTEGRYDKMKMINRYVDDVICTVRGDPDEYLKFENLYT